MAVFQCPPSAQRGLCLTTWQVYTINAGRRREQCHKILKTATSPSIRIRGDRSDSNNNRGNFFFLSRLQLPAKNVYSGYTLSVSLSQYDFRLVHFTINLSPATTENAESYCTLPLSISQIDFVNREGMLKILNRSGRSPKHLKVVHSFHAGSSQMCKKKNKFQDYVKL